MEPAAPPRAVTRHCATGPILSLVTGEDYAGKMPGQGDSAPRQVGTSRPGLLPGALGTLSATMQSISFVGPAFSALLLFQVVAGFAGVSIGFTFLVGGALVLMMALSVGTLAAQLPSAGGYVTYVTRALGGRAGFLVNWIFVVYIAIAPGFIVAYAGYVCEQALQAQYGFRLPWWAVFAAVMVFVTVVVTVGVRPSARTMVVLGIAESGLVLALALWGLAKPGAGGFSFAPLLPGSAPSFHGLYLGVLFAMLAFAGWEGAVPLAEETRNPARSVPVALVGAVLCIVVLFVVANWGLMVGWGTRALPSLLSSQQAPPLVLAHRYWGAAWVFVLVALLNSVVCASIASFNAVTRMWYAMARSGLGPAQFARVDARHHTPTVAIAAQSLLAIGVGLGFGLWLGPVNAFLTLSLLTTLALVVIYVACNVAVVAFFVRSGTRVKPLLHVVFPVLTSAAMIWVGYESLVPLPASPVRWGAAACAAWLALGVAALLASNRDRVRGWASDAGLAFQDRLAAAGGEEA
jgi:amino acid transporter